MKCSPGYVNINVSFECSALSALIVSVSQVIVIQTELNAHLTEQSLQFRRFTYHVPPPTSAQTATSQSWHTNLGNTQMPYDVEFSEN